MKSLAIISLLCVGSITGCASVVSTNPTARVPVPLIAASDSMADIEVKELVKGQGCVTKTLGIISSGDKNFLDTKGETSFGVLERAKAAASFNALSKEGLTTDILINPVWEIHNHETLFVDDVCARVVGYRGVIKGFKPIKTVTRGPGYKDPNVVSLEKLPTNSHFVNASDEIKKSLLPRSPRNLN